MKTKFLPVFLLILSIFVLPIFSAQVKYAGARQSCYGADNGGSFPTEEDWGNIMLNMTDFFPGSTPAGLWIVGTIYNDTCILEFPTPGGNFEMIDFKKSDKHEEYLNYFDPIGVKVFLQVESGDADIEELIDIVFTQYGHHKSVIGFGVDVEWYFESQNPGQGKKVDDNSAEIWDNKVKSYNPNYKMFLKHWDSRWMPPNYRSDIIFVNDGQGFKNVDSLSWFFSKWADNFPQNPVAYQGGYSRDHTWWQYMSLPPQDIGNALAAVCGSDQEFGMFWVDFTLRYEEIEPLLFKDHPTAIEDDNVITFVKNTDNITIVRDVFNPFISIQYNLTGRNDNAALFIITTNGTVINSYILNNNSGKVLLNTNDYASGAYLINVKNGNSFLTKKMFLAK